MHIIGSFTGPFPFSVGKFLCKRSCLIDHCLKRQFKTLYKFNTAKKLIDKFKKDRELELYKSRILTVPNILTISRLAISPLFPWLIMNGHTNYAFGLIVYCGTSDIVIENLAFVNIFHQF